MTTQVVYVEGTWGGAWARARSPFSLYLKARNLAPIRFQGWTGNVDGVPNILEAGRHADWIAGGFAFAYFVKHLAYNDRNVLTHSHGLQPVLYACAREKVALRRLVSVCAPVRSDMHEVAESAAPRIEQWRHIHSNGGDMMQLAGELFDGHLGWTRDWKLRAPNVTNIEIPGIGHSKLLNDPAFFSHWTDDGLIDFLRAGDA